MIILTDDFNLNFLSWSNSTVPYPSLNIRVSSVPLSFVTSFFTKNKISAVPCYFKNPSNINTLLNANIKIKKLVKMPPLWKGDNIILLIPPPPLLRFYLISIS